MPLHGLRLCAVKLICVEYPQNLPSVGHLLKENRHSYLYSKGNSHNVASRYTKFKFMCESKYNITKTFSPAKHLLEQNRQTEIFPVIDPRPYLKVTFRT